jgi:hypothetical protein
VMATLSLPAAFLEESAVIGLVTFANDATLYDNLLIWGGPMRQADDGLRPHQARPTPPSQKKRQWRFRLRSSRHEPLDPSYHRPDPCQTLEVGMDDQPHLTRENRLCPAQSGKFGHPLRYATRQQRAAQAGTHRVQG